MPRKDRDWQKIKAMKPPEEWRRIYWAYGQRRRLALLTAPLVRRA